MKSLYKVFTNIFHKKSNEMKNIDQQLDALRNARPEELPKLFIEICKLLINYYEDGKITPEVLGEKILNCTRSELEAIGELTPINEITDEILELGGYLDAYYMYNSSNDAQKDIAKIKILIGKFDNLNK